MTDYLDAFGFREWPFRVVVDEAFSRVWADRTDLRREFDRRLRMLPELPHSTIQLMWADFGAGKSHTLRHIEGLCNAAEPRRLLPIYTEVPAELDGLHGLYRRFIEYFPEEKLTRIGAVLAKAELPHAANTGARDLRQALKLASSRDGTERAVARDWLLALPGSPNLRVLKSHAITDRIEDQGRIVEVLTELIHLLQRATGMSVLWLVDEYQRVIDVKPKQREALGQGLVSLFNACGSGLHLILSYSVAQQAAVNALTPPALRSRASTFPMISLPFLSREDSTQFVKDLLTVFRLDQEADAFYPFTREAVDQVLAAAEDLSGGRVTPRSLMEILSRLLLDLAESSSGRPTLPITSASCQPHLKAALESQ